ncbi:hypothetical protein OAP68_02040 [Flavobacteriaceae bacterium]|mgnify:FL=1|jgi:hypothetical protein|nr:hypothetical protein [Flavobacteriaceae bacterium]
MNKKVKKYLLKYFLEFLVIVMGISVSFWLSNYQESVDDAEKEIQVYNDLFNGISSLDSTIKNRTFAFKFDLDIIENLLGLSDFNKYNYDDLMTVVIDWRGFGQNQETYSTLKEEGSLKYIVSKELKVKLEKFYGSAANGIISNMEDDIIMQREILNYLNYNYPKLVLRINDYDDKSLILNFKSVLKKDLTLKSLIKAKHRFMSNKYEGILNYNKVQKELKGQIKLELTKP